MSGGRAISLAVLVTTSIPGCSPPGDDVHQFGAMREVMREGRTEPRAELGEVAARPGVYAVGAMAGLEGEVTIADGAVWVTRVEEGHLRATGPEAARGDHATLLTTATVDRWQTIEVEAPVEGAELEVFIEHSARALGIDTSLPFPFVLDGRPMHVDLHVINGTCPHAGAPSPETMPWRWSGAPGTAVEIVGFYAANAAGVMTHHGTAVHCHVVIEMDGRTITGHVDHIRVGPGMTLRLPYPS